MLLYLKSILFGMEEMKFCNISTDGAAGSYYLTIKNEFPLYSTPFKKNFFIASWNDTLICVALYLTSTS